jgi:septum formation topological specificity factor MinE
MIDQYPKRSAPQKIYSVSSLTVKSRKIIKGLTGIGNTGSTQVFSSSAPEKKYNRIFGSIDNSNSKKQNDNKLREPNSAISTHKDSIPTTIFATYNHDYNILTVHNIILKKLGDEKTIELDIYKTQLNKLMVTITKPQSNIDRVITRQSIIDVENKIDEITSGSRLRDYINRITELVERYKELGHNVVQVSFETQDKEENKNVIDEFEEERLTVISKYLKIANDYIKIDVVRKGVRIDSCPVCKINFSDISMEENGLQVCPCGIERYNNLSSLKIKKEFSGFNANTAQFDYEDKENFFKTFQRYQGKQSDKITEKIYVELDTYFSKMKKPTRKDVPNLSMISGKLEGTDIQMMNKALGDLHHSDLYEDMNLICNKYWGWTLPDVSQIADIIMIDYDKTQKVFNSLEKDRTSSLSTQYRLFKHLELRGHWAGAEAFKLVKILDSLEIHENLWRQMCEGTNDPDIFFIPTM